MQRAPCQLAIFLSFAALGCAGSNHGSGVAHSVAVAGALSASANLSQSQVATFQADVRSSWAVAYDPAVPAGCVPGGVAAPVGERPCRAYLLQRLKTTWTLRSVGTPGSMDVPAHVPADLGAPDRLVYLGS